MFTYRIILTSPSLPGARFCSHQISLRKDETDQIRRSLYKKRYYLDEMILKLLFGSAILSISHPNEKDSFIQVCSDVYIAFLCKIVIHPVSQIITPALILRLYQN